MHLFFGICFVCFFTFGNEQRPVLDFWDFPNKIYSICFCLTWIITLVADLKAAFFIMSTKNIVMLFVIPWNHFQIWAFSNFTKYTTSNINMCSYMITWLFVFSRFLIVSCSLVLKLFLSFALTGNTLGSWAVLQDEGSWRSGRGVAAARAENWPTTSTWRPVTDHLPAVLLTVFLFLDDYESKQIKHFLGI